MIRKTLIILTASLLILPPAAFARGQNNQYRHKVREKVKARRTRQQEESKAFRQSLEDLNPKDRTAAIVNHRNTQYQENVAFHSQQHQENMVQLQEKLANNEKLTKEQKQEVLNFREQQYQENVAKQAEQHAESISFLEQVTNDPALSPEEKKAKLKEYRMARKEERKQYRHAQREENKAKRKGIREERQAANQTEE